jgi:prenyltransferase beta subunit/Zn-dependent protease with chaperone function
MNEQRSSTVALLLYVLVIPICLVMITTLVYDISYVVKGDYYLTFSKEYVGWQNADGAIIIWIPSFMVRLFLEIFPLFIFMRAYIGKSIPKGLTSLENPTIIQAVHETAEAVNITPPSIYKTGHQAAHLDVFGTHEKPYLKFSEKFIQLFRETPRELRALILHELFHILDGDLGLLKLRSGLIGTLGKYLLVSLPFQLYTLYTYGMTYSEIPPSGMGTKVLFRVLGGQISLFLGLVLLYVLIASMYREREFLADRRASLKLGSPDDLISALEKLEKPISGGLHVGILSTHPSIGKRINALKRGKSSQMMLVWVAIALGFSTLVITQGFVSFTLFFFDFGSITLERFYSNWGIWIHFLIDAGIPLLVLLTVFRIETTARSLGDFLRKGTLVSALYVALRVGYYALARVLLSRGYSFLEFDSLSTHSRDLDWAGTLWFDSLGRTAFLPRRILYLFNLPFRTQDALEMWIITFSIICLICVTTGILVFAVKRVFKKRDSPSKRSRLVMVSVCEILLIVGFITLQTPRQDRMTAMENWVMSYYKETTYEDPQSQDLVTVACFDFGTQYEIEGDFCGIHILKCLNNLENLTLAQRNSLIKWLEFHQGIDGDFYIMFWFFEMDERASTGEEYYILRSLNSLNALDVIDEEHAIQYALARVEDYPEEVFYVVQILSILEATDRAGQDLHSLIQEYFSNFEKDSNPGYPILCYEGFHSCWETCECIECTYWGVLTLDAVGSLDQQYQESMAEWLMVHYIEEGGFSGEFTGPGPNLGLTYFAVKSLENLGLLQDIDAEKTIQYVLSCQTRKGGFASSPNGEPSYEDTFYATEILHTLGAIERMTESYEITAVLQEIFISLPLAFYVLIAFLVCIDFWLYWKVWK